MSIVLRRYRRNAFAGVLPESEALTPVAFLALALPALYVLLLRDRVQARPAGAPCDA